MSAFDPKRTFADQFCCDAQQTVVRYQPFEKTIKT
jgi:hypothetical protein